MVNLGGGSGTKEGLQGDTNGLPQSLGTPAVSTTLAPVLPLELCILRHSLTLKRRLGGFSHGK